MYISEIYIYLRRTFKTVIYEYYTKQISYKFTPYFIKK